MRASRGPFASIVWSLLALSVTVPTGLEAQEMTNALFRTAGAMEWWRLTWWTEWEAEGDVPAIVERLQLCGAPVDWHLTDFSGDGVPDLVYSGDETALTLVDGWCPIAEGQRTMLLENHEGSFTPVFQERGAVVWIGRPAPWAPVSQLVLRREGCCGDLYTHVIFYSLADADSLRFEEYDRITLLSHLRPPAQMFDVPRAFVITRERYNLRGSPEVLDFAEYPEEFVATFGQGATGVALGAQEDDTGRTWWFVVMDGGSEPLNPPLTGWGRPAGWMSARYLEAPAHDPQRVSP